MPDVIHTRTQLEYVCPKEIYITSLYIKYSQHHFFCHFITLILVKNKHYPENKNTLKKIVVVFLQFNLKMSYTYIRKQIKFANGLLTTSYWGQSLF